MKLTSLTPEERAVRSIHYHQCEGAVVVPICAAIRAAEVEAWNAAIDAVLVSFEHLRGATWQMIARDIRALKKPVTP